MNMIFLGAPGAGKGTQAEVVCKELNIPAISTGNMLREAVKNGTPAGLAAKKYMDAGDLVPDDVVIGVLKDRIAQDDAKNGFILDGFPRTIAQAEALDRFMAKHGREVEHVIGLEVPEDELIDRMIKRGQQTGRADDNPETIKNRLKVYHESTTPLREFYKNAGKYRKINGSGSVNDIFEEIAKAIDGEKA